MKTGVTIRAALLDLGNTILEYSLDGRWREFLLRRLEEMHPLVCEVVGAVSLPAGEFAAAVGGIIGGERARAIERSGQSWHFAQRLEEGLAAVGLRADGNSLERLTDFFYEPIRACNGPYADTSEALDMLRSQGVRLAIITNSPWDTPARLLRGDVEQWDLCRFFDGFICSGEAPWRKPNPSFMLAAAEALGVPAEECLVVGDRLESDTAGARAAGMRCVWMNRAGAPAPADAPRADWAAKSLFEVAEILRSEGKGT
jgi:HAD superfamily hydrolase (TIGR01662 family)